jgi:predicted membrane-bound spermidine synthase
MLERIIGGLVGSGVGILLVIYARKIVEFTGLSSTMERYLGDGGTYLGVRILGIIIFFFSFLNIFGLVDVVFSGIGRSIFGG